jgi:hypothetical protein
MLLILIYFVEKHLICDEIIITFITMIGEKTVSIVIILAGF